MKTLYLLLLALGSATMAFGQKMEYSGQLSTGLSRFTGESATRSTTLNVYQSAPWEMEAFTMNPYGSRHHVGYGASVQAQYVTAGTFLLGAQLGFEVLRSRANIEKVYEHGSQFSSTYQPADGKALIIANNINLHPYLGWRILKSAIDLDLTLGSDVTLNHQLKERSEATTEDGTDYTVKREYGILHTDFRPRVGLTGYKGHFGASLSYAHGLRNHRANYDGMNAKLYTQVIRLGLLYRL